MPGVYLVPRIKFTAVDSALVWTAHSLKVTYELRHMHANIVLVNVNFFMSTYLFFMIMNLVSMNKLVRTSFPSVEEYKLLFYEYSDTKFVFF
jgi:hypothetical protein